MPDSVQDVVGHQINAGSFLSFNDDIRSGAHIEQRIGWRSGFRAVNGIIMVLTGIPVQFNSYISIVEELPVVRKFPLAFRQKTW